MNDFPLTFLLSLAPMLGTAIIPIGWYCLRSHGKDGFAFPQFLIANKSRMAIGGVLMAYISLMITVFPAVQAVVAGGLGSGVTEAAIGWTVGTTLVALVPGNK